MSDISQWVTITQANTEKTSEHGNDDGLSRLPFLILVKVSKKVCDLGCVTLFDNFPVTFEQIAKESQRQNFR